MCSLQFKGGFLSAMALLLCLAACGPVKFSTESSSADNIETGDPSPPVDPPVDPPITPAYKDVDVTSTVEAKASKVDIVLIVDDSNSMLEDNRRLAQRLNTFVTNLKGNAIDWQMCVTTTRALPVSGSTTRVWGASIIWQANAAAPSAALGYILKNSSSTDLSTVFAQTIEYIGANRPNSQDERGIKAAYNHALNGNYNSSAGSSGCYRDGAASAYILISDEDERSVGGELAMEQYAGQEYYALENEDKPQYFVDMIKDTFGAAKRMTFNSIIVKPSDTACKASQDAAGFYSHYGKRYYELSGLTGGGVGSICDTDFYSNLTNIFNRITQSLSSVPLECAPVGAVTVTITPTVSGVTTSVSGQTLNFSTPIPEGRTINLKYKCSDNRSPSSLGNAVPMKEEVGFFAKVIGFFKNLF